MHIAIVGVITKPINSHPFGGTEAFTYLLVKGLVERGNKVTLYCAEGSETQAQEHVFICDPEESRKTESNVEFVYPYTLLEVRKVMEDVKRKKFDILHINILKTFMFSFFMDEFKLPVIHTIHRDFFNNSHIFDIYKKIGFHDNEHFIFVSKNAYNLNLYKKNTSWIHNGIDTDLYSFQARPKDDYLLWLSRIDPLKGPKEAMIVASETNRKLILSGDIDRKKYQEYFDQELKPIIDKNKNLISYEKAQSLERGKELYMNAKAFVLPINWEEPFGFVTTEAMASGTPVISFARGASPEIIQDGETGFLVNYSEDDKRGDWIVKKTGIQGLKEAVERMYSMPTNDYLQMRKNCRDRVVQNFTYKKMAENYEKMYKSIL